MENQLNQAAPQGGGTSGASTPADRLFNAAIDRGLLASFTLYRASGATMYPVSRRVALWLLLALAPEHKLTDCEAQAVAAGKAVRVDFRDCNQNIVLGTYATSGMGAFLRGLMGYCKRKWKQAARRAARQETVDTVVRENKYLHATSDTLYAKIQLHDEQQRAEAVQMGTLAAQARRIVWEAGELAAGRLVLITMGAVGEESRPARSEIYPARVAAYVRKVLGAAPVIGGEYGISFTSAGVTESGIYEPEAALLALNAVVAWNKADRKKCLRRVAALRKQRKQILADLQAARLNGGEGRTV